MKKMKRKIQKLYELSSYLDQQENIKFILKLARPSINILFKLFTEQQLDETKELYIECITKIGYIFLLNDREPDKYIDMALKKSILYIIQIKVIKIAEEI